MTLKDAMMSDSGRTGQCEPGWDPETARRLIEFARPIGKRWFRWEVHGLDSFPPAGGVLTVSNHSGGVLTLDTLIFSTTVYDRFGYDRAVLTLGHNASLSGPIGAWTSRIGIIPADREAATDALQPGSVVVVFPGGVYDAYRPTLRENIIDFKGRTGYVTTALKANVPVVPLISTGGQRSQLFLTRGTWLARRLGLSRFRSDILPITFGIPFGLSCIVPLNIPLPTKIITQVLPPIDIVAQFGEEPDIAAVDAHIRSVMQDALTAMAAKRRWPILG